MHLERRLNLPVSIVATLMVCAAVGCGGGATAGTRGEVAVLRGHTDVVFPVAFSGSGRILASAGAEERTVRLWSVRKRAPLGVPLAGYSGVNTVAFIPGGQTLVYPAGPRIRLFDVRRRKQIAALNSHQSSVVQIALSGDGRTLASTDLDTIRFWDLRPRRQIGKPIMELNGEGMTLNPDGHTFAYPHGTAIRLVDTRTGRQLGPPLQGKNLEVGSLSFSRSGRTLLARGLYDASRLWDLRTHKQLGAALPGGEVEAVTLSPDERTVAYSDGKVIRLLNIATRKSMGVLEGHTDAATSLAFSPDGQMLASGGADKTVRLWDVRAGTPAANR